MFMFTLLADTSSSGVDTVIGQCRVLYDYTGQETEEMTIMQGECRVLFDFKVSSSYRVSHKNINMASVLQDEQFENCSIDHNLVISQLIKIGLLYLKVYCISMHITCLIIFKRRQIQAAISVFLIFMRDPVYNQSCREHGVAGTRLFCTQVLGYSTTSIFDMYYYKLVILL